MAKSVSKAVKEILSNLAYLHFAFENRLANETAVAKFIKPRVEEKLDFQTSLGSIIAAVRRYLLTFSPAKKEQNFFELLKSSKLFLRTAVVEVHLKRTRKALENLSELEKEIRWARGERMYLLFRTNEITIIADKSHLKEIISCAPKKDLLSFNTDRAIITILYDPYYFAESFGGLNFYTGQFAFFGIGIYLIFSTYSATSFVIHEKDAASALKNLSASLNETAKLYAQNHSQNEKNEKKG